MPNLSEGCPQYMAIGGSDAAQKVLFERVSHPFQPFDDRCCGWGQVNAPGAAIADISAAFDQRGFYKSVQYAAQGRPFHIERFGEVFLAHSIPMTKMSQDASHPASGPEMRILDGWRALCPTGEKGNPPSRYGSEHAPSRQGKFLVGSLGTRPKCRPSRIAEAAKSGFCGYPLHFPASALDFRISPRVRAPSRSSPTRRAVRAIRQGTARFKMTPERLQSSDSSRTCIARAIVR